MITTEFNKYQTPLTEENIRKQFTKVVEEEPWTNEDVRWVDTQIRNDIGSIIFLQNLVSKDRRYAKDMPKDEDGKIIVDFSNPHILENMDYFRPMAKEFERTGKYTSIKKSHHPMSRYVRFWKEQVIQSLSDMVREDGEWIPGELYWYWNFVTIKQTVETKIKGKKVTTRSRKPPRTYEGDYLWFHYKDMGKVKQKHSSLLKARGIGYSIKESADLARDFILGANLQVYEDKDPTQSYAIADSDEFLVKDGILNKFVDAVDWCAKHTEFPRIRKLKDSLSDKHWQMGWKKGDKLFGSLNEVIGVTIKNDPQKAHPYSETVYTPEGIKKWKEIKEGSVLFNRHGSTTKVTEIHEFGEQNVYTVTFNDGRKVNTSDAHEWEVYRWDRGKLFSAKYETQELAKLLKQKSIRCNSLRVKIPKQVEFPKQNISIDAYTLGLLLGDGSLNKSTDSRTYLTMKHDDIDSIKHHIPYMVRKDVNQKFDIRNTIFIENIRTELKKLDLFDKKAGTKFIPDIYKYNTSEVRLAMINGLLDTDGSVTKDFGVIEYSTKSKQLADDFIWVIHSLGIGGKISSKVIKGQTYYRCYIYCSPNETRLFNLNRKKELIKNKKENGYANNKREFITITDISYSHKEPVKCVTVDSKDSMYLINQFIPTCNSRGKRGSKIKWEEVGSMPGFITAWQIARPSVEDGDAAFGFMIAGGCLTENNYVWNNQGDLVKIKDLNKNEGIIGFNYGKQIYSKENITYWQPPKNKECIRIETNTGRFIECSTDHPLLTSHATQCRAIELPKENGKRKRYIHKTTKWTEAKNVKIGDQLSILDELPVFSNKQMWNPRLVGWLIGDGCYGYDKTPVLSNCESEINNYVHTNLNYVTEKTYVTKDGKIYEENRIKNICPKLRELGIYGQTKTNKRLPNNIHSYSKESICEFIGGLYDADGYIDKTGRISISQAGKEILLELQLLLQKLGIHGNIIYKKPNLNNPKSKNGHYELEIGDKTSVLRFVENIKLYPKHKQDRLNSFIELYRNKKSERDTFNTGLRFERIVKIENIGIQPVYNLTAGTTHTYVGNGIVTHNTGGAEIKDFQGLYKAFYEPSTLNIFGIPNVYDRKADGKKKVGFFWGAYLNRFDCANHDGVSDIIKALIQIYVKRWSVKQSSDPNLYIQAKAELPITPQEAVLRKEGSIFPVNDLRIYLENDINSDLTSFISPHYVGELKRNSNGVVDWKLSVEHNPIRQYPLPRTTDSTGAVEIFVMPQIDSTGEIPWGRYISGIDPYDQDTGTSLGSMFIFDLWTDKIVAEYTGRPRTANEFYENCLRLLQFYNAQANYENNLKGLFVYFDNNNALKYLCDTPQILRDMEYVKGTKIGNSSKGTRANEYVNKYARKLVADWMVHSRKVGEGENEKTILNLHTIRSIGLIEEALMWTEDGNYDRISAIGMLFLLRESLVKHTEASMSYDEHGDISLSDPFFTGDYTEALIQKSLRQSEKVFNDKDFKKHISTRESQGFMDI